MSLDTQQDEQFILDDDEVVEPTDQELYRTDELLALRERVSQLITDLNEARRERQDAETRLEKFKERVVEVGERYAYDHDMCGVYDDCMREIGLPGRVRQWEFNIEVRYRQRVGIMGRSLAEAKENLRQSEQLWSWQPGLSMDVNGEAVGYARDVEVEIVND